MRKKIIWIIILTIFIIIVKPIRTRTTMENIAKEMLKKDGPLKLFSDNGKPIYQGIEGPIVIHRGKTVEYSWYKILEWGDTTRISAFVYENFLQEFLGVFRKKNPPSVIADTKWYYVYVPEGISKFSDVLPQQQNGKKIDFSTYKPYTRQNEIADSINFTVKPHQLFYFLQKGYFTVVEKNENYTIVDFYQPIGNIIHKYTHDTISTTSAKVLVNDSLEVFILPVVVQLD